MNNDDWREETQDRLKKSHIYCTLKKNCNNDPSGSQVLKLVDDTTYFAYQKTKAILRHMGEFTLHDGDHLFRVLRLMEKLLSKKVVEKLSVPELMLLILSAFFHDIGMAPEEKTVLSWRKVWDSMPDFEDRTDKEEYEKFQRYYSARPDENSKIKSFIKQGKNSDADMVKNYLIVNHIRNTHAHRAREIIKKDWEGKIKYRDTDLTSEFAAICFSHNEDVLSLLALDKNYLCGPDTFACLPLIAVILRLADLLDFDAKRTPAILYSHLFVRHPISLNEWNKHRTIEAWTINSELIQYSAKCEHPAIEASIHAFCDIIDKELSACNNIISSINDFNRINNREISIKIPFKVERSKIETKKDIFGNPLYLYRETKFNLSKNHVIDLLMGTKLYGDPEVALRELIQNSIDACLLRKAQEQSWGNLYKPEIQIKYYTEENDDVLEIIDNGTGMDQHIIDLFYSKVGSSFYKSAEFYDLKSKANAKFTPTSRFGIGILSCFMVADTIVVDTRRVKGSYDYSEPLNLTIEGQESIFCIKPGNIKNPGTSTKLFLRKNKNPWDSMDEDQFIQSVQRVAPNPPFKISIESQSHKKVIDENTFKEIKAESLKDYSWDKNENIREFSIELTDVNNGFVGSAIVAVLESHGLPVEKIEITSKKIEIDGNFYYLDKSISLGSNEINWQSSSITIDDDGEVEISSSNSRLARSKSRLSLHGIEVPTSLFPYSWEMQNNQVKLEWPVPVLLVIDICGNMDLDLNSSRTQIIKSEKWIKFEEKLFLKILAGIAEIADFDYWNKLKDILIKKPLCTEVRKVLIEDDELRLSANPTPKTDYIVYSPMVGTFYRSSFPGAKSYVEVGQRVEIGDTLGIIEALKILNQIEADKSGIVTMILVENAEPVEYGQPLFIINRDIAPSPPLPAGHKLRSPMEGKFYRSPLGAKNFVEVGQRVEVGDTLCVIGVYFDTVEIMNQVEADISGIITMILVKNGQPVRYDQPLFIIE
jgi:molecular chaperone HtpG